MKQHVFHGIFYIRVLSATLKDACESVVPKSTQTIKIAFPQRTSQRLFFEVL